MRYKEAYETVQKALDKHNVVTGERFLDVLFDATINFFGITLVKKIRLEEIAASGVNEYVITNEDFSGNVRRVDIDNGSPIPFIPEESTYKTDSEDYYTDLEKQQGFNIRKGTTEGTITAGTSADPIVLTSASHGLTTGYRLTLSEIVGLLSATGALSALNDLKHTITVVDDDNFSVDIDGSAYGVAYSSGGKWRNDNNYLYLSKAPDSGTINLRYYKKPIARVSLTSLIDLPDLLVEAAIFKVIADSLDFEGPIQVSTDKGIQYLYPSKFFHSRSIDMQKDYFTEYHAGQPFIHMIPPALQIFT